MRARDAEGRRIVKVHQSRIHDQQLGHNVVVIDCIELDNGTRIVFGAHDRYYDMYVTAEVQR